MRLRRTEIQTFGEVEREWKSWSKKKQYEYIAWYYNWYLYLFSQVECEHSTQYQNQSLTHTYVCLAADFLVSGLTCSFYYLTLYTCSTEFGAFILLFSRPLFHWNHSFQPSPPTLRFSLLNHKPSVKCGASLALLPRMISTAAVNSPLSYPEDTTHDIPPQTLALASFPLHLPPSSLSHKGDDADSRLSTPWSHAHNSLTCCDSPH